MAAEIAKNMSPDMLLDGSATASFASGIVPLSDRPVRPLTVTEAFERSVRARRA